MVAAAVVSAVALCSGVGVAAMVAAAVVSAVALCGLERFHSAQHALSHFYWWSAFWSALQGLMTFSFAVAGVALL